MSTARRLTTLLAVVAAMPLIMGAGGNNPPIGLEIITSSITAAIILDPHLNSGEPDFSADGTPSGRIGRITLTRKGVGTATETFEIPVIGSTFGSFALGCNTNPGNLEARFGNATFPRPWSAGSRRRFS